MSSADFKVLSDFFSTVTSLLVTAEWEVQNLVRHIRISMNRWSYMRQNLQLFLNIFTSKSTPCVASYTKTLISKLTAQKTQSFAKSLCLNDSVFLGNGVADTRFQGSRSSGPTVPLKRRHDCPSKS
jgi:predicted ATPase